jgi:hypothetical protein
MASKIKREYHSGDHLHPGDAGYAAMAQAADSPRAAEPNRSKTSVEVRHPCLIVATSRIRSSQCARIGSSDTSD